MIQLFHQNGFARLLVVLAVLGAPVLHAQSHWTNSVGGNFTNSANWLTTVPIHNGTAVFTNNGDYTVSFSATTNTLNAYFTTNTSGTVTLDITGFQWRVGNEFVVGRALGSTATVAVAGGTLFVTNLARTATVTIGDAGAGSMLVTAGTVRASNLILGRTSTGLGSLVVSGASTVFSNSNTAIIGQAGSGNSLVVAGGATMFSTNGHIGFESTSHSNSVTVTGTGSTWFKALGNVFNIGTTGSWNTLTVTNNGYFYAGNSLHLGAETGANFNTLKITDGGSLSTMFNIVVGRNGVSNSMVISDGGVAVTATSGSALNRGSIGQFAGSDYNQAIVTGSGSLWSNRVHLIIGESGAFNQLQIANGGTVVVVSNSIIGSSDTAAGNQVVVNGGQWLNTSLGTAATNLIVGFSGAGNSVVVSNGGKVVSAGGVIGYSASSSNNSVLVTGANSLWTNNHSSTIGFLVGLSGSSNTLTVANQASLVSTANSIFVGFQTGGNFNTVSVTSSGRVYSAFAVAVGNVGFGNRMEIASGGEVAGADGFLGRAAVTSSNNTVLVTGSGSLWTIRGDLYVGNFGAGNSLTISNGGKVVSENATVGFRATSTDNTVTVGGNGATWLVNSGLTIGATGTAARVFIESGGNVGGSSQTTIGQLGQGTLTMNGGEYLQAGTMILGSNTTGSGTVNLNTGSKLVIDGGGAGGLIIGNRGGANGNLNINGGTLIISNLAATGVQGLNTNGVFVGYGNGTAANGGNGTITISSGTVTNYGTLVLGNNFVGTGNNSAGVFNQTGGTWNQRDQIQVGRWGTGTLTMSGGQFEINVETLTALLVGNGGGATGTVWMVGNDAVLTVNAVLSVARNGVGRFIVSNGTVSVGGDLGLLDAGSGAAGRGSLIVAGGSVATASNVVMGSAINNGIGMVLVASGGVLESRGLVMSNTLNAASSMTNHGGIFQFITAAPQILPLSAGRIVVTNGTIAFRALDDANVKANWVGGNQLSNIVYRGDNTFRLNAASNIVAASQAYTFATGLGATNFVNLEMVNGHTAYRGGDITIGAAGSLLVSNTVATFATRVSNLATARVVNSTASFSAELVNAGRLVGNNSALTGLLTLSNGTVATEGGSAQTWTVAGNLMGNNTIDTSGGSLTLSGVYTNSGNLTKTGSGRLNLTGNNTYTGLTTVNGGTLSVNGALSGSDVIAASGGTLGGTGMISGAVTVSSGGAYAPGNGIGRQQVGSLSVGAGSILNFEFTTTPLTNDQVVVNSVNGLSVAGGGVNLYQAGGTTTYDARGTYQLLQFNGVIAGAATNLSVLNPVANRTYAFAEVGDWVTLYIAGTLGWSPLGGSTNSLWSNPQNWAGGSVPIPHDELLFDGNTRVSNTNNLTVNTPYKGITFTNTAGAFVLNGNAIHLEGPVKNLSGNTQTIQLPLVLTAGDGVFVAQGGNLVVSGNISESGGSYGLIKSGAQALVLSGNNTYSGATVVNGGTLIVNGTIGSTAGLTLAAGTGLGGHGTIAGLVSGSGTISPGNSPGILTINQLDPSANMNFNFEFTQVGSPDYTQPTASGNDVLRITDGAPFVVSLGITNTVNLYVTAPLLAGQTNVIRGGFYTDLNSPFDAAITGATYNLYINNQPYFTNLLYVTTFNDQAFSQNGWVMQFGVLGVETLTVIPEPSTLLLVIGGAVTLYYSRRRQRRQGAPANC